MANRRTKLAKGNLHEGSRRIGETTIANDCGTVITFDAQDDHVLVTLEEDENDDEFCIYAQDVRELLGVTIPCGTCATGPFNGSQRNPGACARYTPIAAGPDKVRAAARELREAWDRKLRKGRGMLDVIARIDALCCVLDDETEEVDGQ